MLAQSWEMPTKWSQGPVGASEMAAQILKEIGNVFSPRRKYHKMKAGLRLEKRDSEISHLVRRPLL